MGDRHPNPIRSDLYCASAEQRRYGVIRTTLITFGVAAFGFLQSREELIPKPEAFGLGGSAIAYILVGLAVQVLLFGIHGLIERHALDAERAAPARLIIELVGDGISVLLFALATFGAILQTAGEV